MGHNPLFTGSENYQNYRKQKRLRKIARERGKKW
jgi:hypothetical protein